MTPDHRDFQRETSRRSVPSGVGLLGAVIALAVGARIATLAASGSTLLGLVVIVASSIPLVLWLRSARTSAQRIAELSDLARKVVGYFVAGLAVAIGTVLVLEPTAWWSVSAAIAIWILGFGIITASFRSDRRAQTLYVLAVLGFPVLMVWLLDAPVV